jgi:hypothetical protein
MRLYVRAQNGIASYISSDDGMNWSQESEMRIEDPQGYIAADSSIVEMEDGGWVLYYKLQEMQ